MNALMRSVTKYAAAGAAINGCAYALGNKIRGGGGRDKRMRSVTKCATAEAAIDGCAYALGAIDTRGGGARDN